MKKSLNKLSTTKYFYNVLMDVSIGSFIFGIMFFIFWDSDGYIWALPLFIIFLIFFIISVSIYCYYKYLKKEKKYNQQELDKLIAEINKNKDIKFELKKVSNSFNQFKLFAPQENEDNSLKQSDVVVQGIYQGHEFELGTYIRTSKQKNEMVQKNIGIIENNNNLYRNLILNFKIKSDKKLILTKRPNDLIDVTQSIEQFYKEEIELTKEEKDKLYQFIVNKKIIPSFKVNNHDCSILLDTYNIYSWNDTSFTLLEYQNKDFDIRNEITKIINCLKIYDELINLWD